MTDKDIIKSIAENLSIRNSSAALNNYQVLGNNIKYVNDILEKAVNSLKSTLHQVESSLDDDSLMNNDFKDDSNPLYYFRKIIPRIILNDISVIEKFILFTKPDIRDSITIHNVGELRKTFFDFNNLVTSARQFVDSLVVDSYQLIQLDIKEVNFHVLSSLSSFDKYATKSIKQGLFNTEIQNSLNEFENLSFNERVRGRESAITKCSKKSFGNKLDYIFNNLSLTAENDFKEEVKNLFSFSSEFIHIGYVSTFFTSSNLSEVIFKDDIGPYLPSTENFSELKYEILETSTNLFFKIYLPSLILALEKIFTQNAYSSFKNSLTQTIEFVKKSLETRNNEYYFFIVQGLIGSNSIIKLPCMCGSVRAWEPPHDKSKIFCSNCGSKFNLIEVEKDSGYIITSNGPIKPIGSKVPDFADLPEQKQIELMKKCEEAVRDNT
ncbi:MAG: hypothetical protein WD607_02520 [Candidatus Paceibacterota bacterium]